MSVIETSRAARLEAVYRHTPTGELQDELAFREGHPSKAAARIADEIRAVLDYRMARTAFAI